MFTINMQSGLSGRDRAVLALCSGLYCSVYVRVFYLPMNLDQALLDRFIVYLQHVRCGYSTVERTTY